MALSGRQYSYDLLTGDYLRIHKGRWPETDHDVDEGFARVEHLRLLDQEAVETLFADPAWHTTLVVVSVHGLSGVVVLRAEDKVTVMAFANPDREILERRNRWSGRPEMEFTDSRLPTEAERQAADSLDAALRPRVNEADWYPSLFRDSFARRLKGSMGCGPCPCRRYPGRTASQIAACVGSPTPTGMPCPMNRPLTLRRSYPRKGSR
jgi:hypothetical protein